MNDHENLSIQLILLSLFIILMTGSNCLAMPAFNIKNVPATPDYEQAEGWLARPAKPDLQVDVFFVYPWPMEQEFMQELFDAVAVEGAILISYHKAGEICAFQKLDSENSAF